MVILMSWFSRGEKKIKQSDMLIKAQALNLANLLRIQAMTSSLSGVEPDSPRRIVISLTTFDKRIDDVYLCIESLLQQSLRPNRIILWLSEEEFPHGTELPATLLRQKSRGLEICFCSRDIGPYKKIIPTLSLCPEDNIVTVDDDVMYPVDMLDLLYRRHLVFPKAVVANVTHQLARDPNGKLMPYKQWPRGYQVDAPKDDVYPVGIGGVLYPPNSFHPLVLDESLFTRLCPRADDVWLKIMAKKVGTLAVSVNDHRAWAKRNLMIDGSQQFALKRSNKSKIAGNDIKIVQVLKYFDIAF